MYVLDSDILSLLHAGHERVGHAGKTWIPPTLRQP